MPDESDLYRDMRGKRNAREVGAQIAEALGLPRPETNREKSRILQAACWRCVPVTYLQLEHTSAGVARDARRLIGGATLAA